MKPAQIVRALIKSRREVAIVSLPEDGSDVAVRLLNDSEVADGNADAFAFIVKQCKAKDIDVSKYCDASPDSYAREQVRQMIFRAFRLATDAEVPFFESLEQIRSLDATYVQALYDVYVDHLDRKSTAKQVMDEAIADFVAAMVDDPSLDHQLAQVDGATLIRVVRFMIRTAASAPREPESPAA